MPDIIAMGECMVEMYSRQPIAEARAFRRFYGGDTLNTLVAARRLGSSVGYITRVGDDPFAPYLLKSWRREGIDTSPVKLVEGFNGLYFIALLPDGQRQFIYYRKGSAASALSPADIDPDYIAAAKVLHLSGITQALSPSAREATLAAARMARERGVLVSYDPNFRPRLWSASEARQALAEILHYVNIILPSVPNDTEALFDLSDNGQIIRYLWSAGVQTVALKMGSGGCLVGHDGLMVYVNAHAPERIVDTTGAGDAFNGAFLHGLTHGMEPVEAARLGVITAGCKVRGHGAVASLPRRREVEHILRQLMREKEQRPSDG